jgi:hypothetical protein
MMKTGVVERMLQVERTVITQARFERGQFSEVGVCSSAETGVHNLPLQFFTKAFPFLYKFGLKWTYIAAGSLPENPALTVLCPHGSTEELKLFTDISSVLD